VVTMPATYSDAQQLATAHNMRRTFTRLAAVAVATALIVATTVQALNSQSDATVSSSSLTTTTDLVVDAPLQLGRPH